MSAVDAAQSSLQDLGKGEEWGGNEHSCRNDQHILWWNWVISAETKYRGVTAVFLQPLLPGRIQRQRIWLPPSILPKLASVHPPGASSRPKEKLQQQILSNRGRSQKPQELMSQLQRGRCTLKVVLVTGVNIQRQGNWGLIVTSIGRKTATGTSVASPSPLHYHQSRLILVKVPGELQEAQHCI